MKKLICMIPTSGKTKEQIKAEALEAFQAAGVLKETALVSRINLAISESVVFKVWKKLQEAEELEGLSDDEVMEKVVGTVEGLVDLAVLGVGKE